MGQVQNIHLHQQERLGKFYYLLGLVRQHGLHHLLHKHNYWDLPLL
jgi:hypothetical protein